MTIISRLEHAGEVVNCEKLPIAHKLWGTDVDITAYGQVGYIEDREIVVRLTADESAPLAVYKEDNDPVYKDSALEFFLNFEPDNIFYINFEVNANGALLCHYGKRKDRRPILNEERRVFVATERTETEWTATLRIPIAVIEACFDDVKLKKGSVISFNLYKICEREDNLHFISHTFIPTEDPDFHLVQYFARGELE